ncbi:hypothetical protein Q4F19_17225 [Sphingomonas sp. BIUV-7]|uniref:DUF2188 domain-containing protein n=1 Tax=Sphingomonas natans TaxID=3063330 RepID=A0ABT8YCP9_9SPHN|nr:hypothetical protein [Sphingomonas sp. BIUV-7]MDO6416131.1 hypothetical protein [Sphingomonas sp. BIUV-7]
MARQGTGPDHNETIFVEAVRIPASDRGAPEMEMDGSTYRIARGLDGQWLISVHGAIMRFSNVDDAIRCASLAAKTELLCGKRPVLAIQQNDGTFRTESPA